jgi:CheY-like chemotaxis protein
MFGSKVAAALQGAGHEVEVCGSVTQARDALGRADAVFADLASDAAAGLQLAEEIPDRTPSLAVYSHVEADTRERAEAAGFDRVVPRSRFMREGPALVEGLLSAG